MDFTICNIIMLCSIRFKVMEKSWKIFPIYFEIFPMGFKELQNVIKVLIRKDCLF